MSNSFKILLGTLLVLTLAGLGYLYSNGSDLQGSFFPSLRTTTVDSYGYWNATYPGFYAWCTGTKHATSLTVSHFNSLTPRTTGIPNCY